jgi:heme-degrading monooxygenase HmoA
LREGVSLAQIGNVKFDLDLINRFNDIQGIVKVDNHCAPGGAGMRAEVTAKWGYVVLWEFRPVVGAEARFEKAYGPRGAWARLFATGEGFVATDLNRDLKDPARYLTLDFWASREAYDAFRAKHAAEYAAIDRECEALTVEEKPLGAFERIVAG